MRKFVEGDTSTYGGAHIARWLRKIGEPFVFGLNPQERKDLALFLRALQGDPVDPMVADRGRMPRMGRAP